MEFTEELVMAITQLQQQKVGALIVVERDIGLRSFIESGVPLEAFLSRDLPAHDLSSRKRAARWRSHPAERQDRGGCLFLPLTIRPALARHLGYPAQGLAIGVTEETDCLSLIVSEETACISVAAFGDIELDVTPERLEQRITEHLIRRKIPQLRPKQQAWREEQHLEREAARDARAD